MNDKEKFFELLSAAQSKDNYVKATFTEFLNRGVRLDELSEEKLFEILPEFADSLTQKYIKNNHTFDDIPPNSKKLLEFLASVSSKSKSLEECQDPETVSDLTFNEIAGQTHVKIDLEKNYIYPFTYPGLFMSKSKGVLLYGAPGTGKSLMASAATASIPNVAFFAPTPGDIKGKYEGETEKNIDKVFTCAENTVLFSKGKYRLSIIFFDEFDSLAGQRNDDPSMTRSVNAFLQAMDGIKKRENTSVIAATNYPWSIDEAILRRFSARVFIDLPDEEAREWLIRAAIAENFSYPWTPKKERIKNLVRGRDENNKIVWNDLAFGIMRRYGVGHCFKATGNDILSPGNIQEFVKKMGPSKEAKAIINKIKNQRQYVDPETIDDEDTKIKFGYSGSDIAKVMAIAIQDAAFRTLQGPLQKIDLGNSQGEFYIGTPDPKGGYAALPEVVSKFRDSSGRAKLKLISPEEYPRILNFSLCAEDIDRAIEKYPSTGKNSMYVKLLNYRYLNISP